MASRRCRLRRYLVSAGESGRRRLRRPSCYVRSPEWQAGDSVCDGRPSGRRLVCHGFAEGEDAVIRAYMAALLAGASAVCSLPASDAPPAELFRVLKQPVPSGPRITPYLRYQAERAWKEDEARQKARDAIRDDAGLLNPQDDIRQKLLAINGGLAGATTD